MIADIQELETPCLRCQGRGKRTDIESEEGFSECLECGGSGFKPTPIGARILELIRHNSRVKISAELQVSSAQ